MDSKSFSKILKAIMALNKEIDEFSKDVGKYFDGGSFCVIGDEAIATLTEELEKSLLNKGVKYSGWIDWWLYESASKYVWIDNIEYEIRTPTDLYNLITDRLGKTKGAAR